MTPQETFNALMQGKRVKLTDNAKKRGFEPYKENPDTNEFWIYQIEASSVNLYNEETEEVYYDYQFEDISLL